MISKKFILPVAVVCIMITFGLLSFWKLSVKTTHNRLSPIANNHFGNNFNFETSKRNTMTFTFTSSYKHTGLGAFAPNKYNKLMNYPGGRLYYSDKLKKHLKQQSYKFSRRFVAGHSVKAK